MEKSIKITLIIAATVLILGVLGVVTFNGFVDSVNPSNTISSAGSSTIKVVPDRISIYLSVITSAQTADTAQKNNSEIVNKLSEKLMVAGFDKDEIKTQSFNVYPDYSWINGVSKLKGYTANHELKLDVTSDNSMVIGKAIDVATESGVLISYINFELSKDLEESYKTQALEKATINARTKAEAIAKGLDKEIVKVVSVSTSDFNYYPWRTYSMDSGIADSSPGVLMENAALAKQATTNINPSEREVTANVVVVFKIN